MDYEYKKSDGTFIHCYGEVCEDANYFVSCCDENHDAIFAATDYTKCNTWKKVCDYIVERMCGEYPDCDIQQIEAGWPMETLGMIFVWCIVLGIAGYAADQLRSIIKGDWDQ